MIVLVSSWILVLVPSDAVSLTSQHGWLKCRRVQVFSRFSLSLPSISLDGHLLLSLSLHLSGRISHSPPLSREGILAVTGRTLLCFSFAFGVDVINMTKYIAIIVIVIIIYLLAMQVGAREAINYESNG